MGYQIKYDLKGSRKIRIRRLAVDRKALIPPVVAILILLTVLFWPGVKNVLIPGDDAITEAALDSLVQELRSGENFESAITTFCQEIIDHGLSER